MSKLLAANQAGHLRHYNERLDAYELNVSEDQLRDAPVLATGWDTGVIGRD